MKQSLGLRIDFLQNDLRAQADKNRRHYMEAVESATWAEQRGMADYAAIKRQIGLEKLAMYDALIEALQAVDAYLHEEITAYEKTFTGALDNQR